MSRGRNLTAMAEAAAFFDLDKTIIAKSSVLAFGKFFYREGLLSRRAIVRERVRAGALHARRSRRVEDGRGARGDARDHAGLEPGARRVDRARDARRGRHPDHLRGGGRAHRRAQGQRPQGRDRLVVAATRWCSRSRDYLGADEAIATRAEARRRRQLHGRALVLRVRTAQGRPRSASSRRATASTSPSRTPTATPSPTSRSSRRSGHPVAVNPDRDLARVRAGARVGDPPVPPPGAPARSHARRRSRRRPSRSARSSLAAGAGAAAWWWWRTRSTPETRQAATAPRARAPRTGPG